mmetsp:Transcript_70781/g.178457  ORF Transcript_70781/g.178457 Transcript_70781/m.178457 type:complete len:728 (-) Transcript_70781:246-2429(-)|eukprot:CAMPEP_0115211726 /NCGR_PEP_ID=MMETSP0270-20121206/22913_1 /TAXON_ID=71861 /ORGANISM="Scrippsiella trochoidea, Strain CCMP3099" /LENGTH=727 /DNA_ID=CAMNT_0002625425 /DNA_START=109 /DNA_END=2292 /DNA_ORIENTATION=-
MAATFAALLPLPLLSLLLSHMLVTIAAGQVMKGISYGPMPLKGTGQHIPLDDFMSDAAKPLWGSHGRGDLATMRQLGANVVRLYGNDPRQSHTAFFDEARALGLGVIPGLSDWPFMQMQGSCAETGYNCYEQVRESFAGNLRNGWLLEDGTYHPALQQVIVVNEPDLKLPGMHDPQSYSRAVISAVDGMLAAEEEAQVTGARVNFTVTFSFGFCETCQQSQAAGAKPGLGQMLELRNAFLNPGAYGYTPRHDLAAFYASRFTNSFNTANPSDELPHLFLDAYAIEFPTVPVFIGEFHSVHPPRDQAWDVWNMLQIAQNSSLLQGISFFEFQVRYDKGGSEMDFGMFGLGSYSLGKFDFFGYTYDIWCLVPITNAASDLSLPDSITWAFGGQMIQYDMLCNPNPEKVPLTPEGLALIWEQSDVHLQAAFIARMVRHAGGNILDEEALVEFSRSTSRGTGPWNAVTTWETLQGSLKGDLAWVSWDPFAACAADRLATEGAVGLAMEKACNSTWFDCANIPASCSGSTWDMADYVLSVYYNERGQDAFSDCYFAGAATMARTASSAVVSQCIVSRDPQTTVLTDEGYQAVLSQASSDAVEQFLRRVVEEEMSAIVTDSAALAELASNPPASMWDVRSILTQAAWVTKVQDGEEQDRAAGDSRVFLDWRLWGAAALGAIVLLTIMGVVVHVRCKRWRGSDDGRALSAGRQAARRAATDGTAAPPPAGDDAA